MTENVQFNSYDINEIFLLIFQKEVKGTGLHLHLVTSPDGNPQTKPGSLQKHPTIKKKRSSQLIRKIEIVSVKTIYIKGFFQS